MARLKRSMGRFPVHAATGVVLLALIALAVPLRLSSTREVEAGDFRDDLYFRLSVILIPTPPLRDRREDIEPLIEHFVSSFAAEDNFRPKQFSREAMDRLKKHRWKGNVRELRNTVERALIMAKWDVIDVNDLPETIRSEISGNTKCGPRPGRRRGATKTSARAIESVALRSSPREQLS